MVHLKCILIYVCLVIQVFGKRRVKSKKYLDSDDDSDEIDSRNDREDESESYEDDEITKPTSLSMDMNSEIQKLVFGAIFSKLLSTLVQPSSNAIIPAIGDPTRSPMCPTVVCPTVVCPTATCPTTDTARRDNFPGESTRLLADESVDDSTSQKSYNLQRSKTKFSQSINDIMPLTILVCGIGGYTNYELTDKSLVSDIVGYYPWMAIVFINGKYDEHSVGTLINEYFVLSHNNINTKSQETINTKHLKIGLGYSHLILPQKDSPLKNIGPLSYNFSVDKFIFNDALGLIKLEGRVIFNKAIAPICLPLSSTMKLTAFINKQVTAVGWNHLLNHHKVIVLASYLTVTETAKCRTESDLNPNQNMELELDDIICAEIIPDGVIDQKNCITGIAAPIMYKSSRSKWYLIGLTMSDLCTERDKPVEAHRIAFYLKWIIDNAKIKNTVYSQEPIT